jgi:uncharacterized protein YdhG (YjbR/CyaY superfamily)
MADETRSGKSMAPPSTVDEYLATLPHEVRAALEQLRATIRAAAPMAEESISYRIPAYKHHGLLVGFAAATNHCTFHLMSPESIEAHAADLKGYELNKGSIRFRPEEPLPDELVTELVTARIAENEARAKK